jgi:hypothetical protein
VATRTSRAAAASMSRCTCGAPTRDRGKVRHETLANLSGLGEQTVASIEAALKGVQLVPARRRIAYRATTTVGEDFAAEQQFLRSLSAEPFEAA